jgi:hypothetical protein
MLLDVIVERRRKWCDETLYHKYYTNYTKIVFIALKKKKLLTISISDGNNNSSVYIIFNIIYKNIHNNIICSLSAKSNIYDQKICKINI